MVISGSALADVSMPTSWGDQYRGEELEGVSAEIKESRVSRGHMIKG